MAPNPFQKNEDMNNKHNKLVTNQKKLKNKAKDLTLILTTLYPALEISINEGVSQDDAIRILNKLIIDIDSDETQWYEKSNEYLTYLEAKGQEVDSKDGIVLIKNGTKQWDRILR